MCGIGGAWLPTGSLPHPTTLAKLRGCLARRGPDGDGTHAEPGLILAHRRLAIIDLSDRGSQPMAVDGGRLWLVFNGEIYNYRDLKRRLEDRFLFASDSDSEVILRLYDAHADDPAAMLRQLRGMFAFALWDSERRRLLLARDRFGIKPLFVHESSAGVFFASTLDALAAFPEVPRRLDWTSVFDQVSLLCPPGPHTYYEDVRQVEPGTALIVGAGERRDIRYWSLPVRECDWLQPEAAHGQLEERLAEVARLHLVADVEVGSFLSGGLDSGLVTAYANTQAERPLRTYSASFPGQAIDEGPWARDASDRIRTRHFEVLLRGNLLDEFEDVVAAMDQPLGLESALPLYRLARAASRDLKVVLTGDGGDEVFAGYNRHRVPFGRLSPKVAWIPRALRPWVVSLGSAALRPVASALGARAGHARYLLGSLVQDAPAEYLARVRLLPSDVVLSLLRPEVRCQVDLRRQERRVRAIWERLNGAHLLHRMLAVDLSTTLVDEMLTKSDRMTMAWGLEGRVPLLDHELVEFAFSIEPSALCSETQGKLPLRRVASRLLGQESAQRRKYGFTTSFGRDLANPSTRDRVDELLRRACEPGLFDASSVRSLRAQAETGNPYSAGVLLAVLTAGLWADQRGIVA
jgi:asparagine synthase (glutamine-hydrolysing)